MPYGHAESNDLLRNRERSTRCARSSATEFGVRNSEYSLFPSETLREREKLRNGVRSSEYSLCPSDNGAYKVRPQMTHTAPQLREREKLRNGVMIFSLNYGR